MFEDLLKEIEATQEEKRPTPVPEETLNRRVALAAVRRVGVARVVSATLGGVRLLGAG